MKIVLVRENSLSIIQFIFDLQTSQLVWIFLIVSKKLITDLHTLTLFNFNFFLLFLAVNKYYVLVSIKYFWLLEQMFTLQYSVFDYTLV